MEQTNSNNESRVQKTLLNARVNLFFYFLTLVLSFFSRKIFLDCLGADFVGLTGTLQNLLGFLNLAELGIGTAIGYLLYKPLFNKDHAKINEIISVMGYLYRWIGLIILGGGIILSLFLPLIFPDSDTGFHLSLIYFAYYAFLTSSLIGYFINYRQNLLGADQRNYVVTGYFQTMNILKTIIQMALAYYTGSYYLWVAIELSFGIIYSFILNWKINSTYPWLRVDNTIGKDVLRKYPEVMKKTKQLFIHKITGFVQFQITPFLTYAFVSLESVALLGNYTLLIDKVTGLMNSVLDSTTAGIGNLIAEDNKVKILNVFWTICLIRSYVAIILLFIGYVCFDNFIILWIGKNYLLPKTVLILLLLRIYIQLTTGCIGQFIYGYGLFGDVWSAVMQTILFLSFAITGGYKYGLSGILFAAVISIFIIQGLWKPYYLYKYGFKVPVIKYWIKWLKIAVINLTIFSAGLYLYNVSKVENSINLMILFAKYMLITAIFSIFSFVVYCLSYVELRNTLRDYLKK